MRHENLWGPPRPRAQPSLGLPAPALCCTPWWAAWHGRSPRPPCRPGTVIPIPQAGRTRPATCPGPHSPNKQAGLHPGCQLQSPGSLHPPPAGPSLPSPLQRVSQIALREVSGPGGSLEGRRGSACRPPASPAAGTSCAHRQWGQLACHRVCPSRNPLVVQWLVLSLPRAQGSIPDHGTKTPRAAQRGQKNKKFKNKIAQLVKKPPAIQETPI